MNNALKELRETALFQLIEKHPGLPYPESLVHRFSDKTANGLTDCIKRYVQMKGGQCERVANQGKYVDQRQTYIDVLGHTKTIGRGKWIQGQGSKGSSDLHAVIRGRAVKIEVKIGRDKQSPDQKKYQEAIEASGGIYYIAKDFESFYKWYNLTFKD